MFVSQSLRWNVARDCPLKVWWHQIRSQTSSWVELSKVDVEREWGATVAAKRAKCPELATFCFYVCGYPVMDEIWSFFLFHQKF